MLYDTFISYSTNDKAVADAMCHRLEQRGLRCWIAPRDVRPGEDYAAEIIDAIAASRALVLVFTANANASKHVKNEVERAVSHGIPVIPFRTQDVQPAKSLELFLGARHWLDAMTRPMEAHFDRLAQHLKILSGAAGAEIAAGAAGADGTRSVAAAWGGPSSRGWPKPLPLAVVLVLLTALGAAVGWIVATRPQPAPVGPPASAEAATPRSAGTEVPVAVAVNPAPAAPKAPAVAERTVAAEKEALTSVGMKLRLIPAGEFLMGNSHTMDEEMRAFKPYYEVKYTEAGSRNQYPRHRVRITQPFYLGACDVTRGQFRRFVAATHYKTDAEKNGKGGRGYNGVAWLQMRAYNWHNAGSGFAQTDAHPVINVSWNDAMAFCDWLGRKEGKTYRLPTEAEWEYACRAKTTTRYWCGEDPEQLAQVGNAADAAYKARFPYAQVIRSNDGYVFTSPVGHFSPNAFGLYDVHGDVWQWCSDWFDVNYYAASPVDDPKGPGKGIFRVCRGGSYACAPATCRSAARGCLRPDACDSDIGFRVAIVLPASAAGSPPGTDADSPPKDGGAAAKTLVNSLGMKFALIPAGQFMMGNGHSFEKEAKAFEPYENVFPAGNLQWEYPRHHVRITRPFYLGENHVTRGQFAQFVEASGYKTDVEKSGKGGEGYDGKLVRQAPEYTWRNTGFAQTDDHPVVNVSWNDAIAFCDWLGRQDGKTYRLPTEAEWEYAARAGTSTRFCRGDDPEMLAQTANVADAAYKAKFPNTHTIHGNDGYVFTSPVGNFPPNGFGLCDMNGNVCDWCWDWHDRGYYAVSPIDDPQGPPSGIYRVGRGGNWTTEPYRCEVCQRFRDVPSGGYATVGFRVARTK